MTPAEHTQVIRNLGAAREIVIRYDRLNGDQLDRIVAAFDAADQLLVDQHAEIKRLERDRDEQLAQRDAEITKRRNSYQELQAEVAQLATERDQARTELDRATDGAGKRRVHDLQHQLEAMRAERDKAMHRAALANGRAERYRADAEAAEGQLEQIAAVINRTPFPPERDTWQDYADERAQLPDQLAPGPRRGPTPARPHTETDHNREH